MSLFQLIRRSLIYYRRGNLAIVMGVIVATAVIGGALIVGDSVRDSLREMTLKRLGKVRHALRSHRFFREELVTGVQGPNMVPALWMDGSAETPGPKTRRATGLDIVGIDKRLWRFLDHADRQAPIAGEVILGARVADELELQQGSEMTLWVEIPETIPRDSLLGDREEVAQEIPVTVSVVLSDEEGASRFSIEASQQLSKTVYVNLQFLQERLGLEEVRATRRNPGGKPARVNAAFATAGKAASVAWHITPTDLGLKVGLSTDQNYLSITSNSLVVDEAAADAVTSWMPPRSPEQDGGRLLTSPIHVYLANRISNAAEQNRSSGYSIIAGLDLTDKDPFGPFTLMDGTEARTPGENEILLNEWLAADLGVGVGETIRVDYFEAGTYGDEPEVASEFRVAGIVKLEGPAQDRSLTPKVEGITDVKSIRDWRRPFPMDMERVTDRDDEYWEKYGPTPKAFVSLETAQRLWATRHGRLSSLRFAYEVPPGRSLAAIEHARSVIELHEESFRKGPFLRRDEKALGLSFQPVREQGLQAAAGANDFTGLFIGFSFFLIVAAAILISLLFRLGIDHRIRDVGLMAAVGMTDRQVRRLFLGEGGVLVLLGVVPGIAAAVGYAAVMMYGLRTWWIGATGTRFLFLSVRPVTLLVSALTAAVLSLFVIWLSVRRLKHVVPRELLSGSAQLQDNAPPKRARLMTLCGAAFAGLLLGAVLAGVIPSSEAFGGMSWQVVSFFLIALALLAAGISGLAWWFGRDQARAIRGNGPVALCRLGLRNASRNRARSLFTVGLMAFAVFVITAVATGRRNPAVEVPDRNSGNGGFTLVAESSQPLLFDLNTEEGRLKLGFTDSAAWPQGLTVHRFRMKPGEDGSCLNLYQTNVPTVLGVTDEMVERGGFRFADTKADDPWQLLKGESEAIPVLGDLNTLQFGLKKGIGDLIDETPVPERGMTVAGMFDGSVFQGVLLMSEANFRERFPKVTGYRYFLIDVPEGVDAESVATMLETQLTPYGMDVERVADRIAEFLTVQNTYLSTFQTLGGLGLLLGTLGLATVMLRNIIERRAELALMRAVGADSTKLSWLVLIENACLLLFGLLLGAGCALLAMTPHLLKTGADVPWSSLLLLLVGVLTIGMSAAWLAVRRAVSTPVLSTLRAE